MVVGASRPTHVYTCRPVVPLASVVLKLLSVSMWWFRIRVIRLGPSTVALKLLTVMSTLVQALCTVLVVPPLSSSIVLGLKVLSVLWNSLYGRALFIVIVLLFMLVMSVSM